MESQFSEDELASPDKNFAPTPLRRAGLASHLDNTPTVTKDDTTLSSLACQLDGWAASSPDKQRLPTRKQRGIFFFGGPTEMTLDQKGSVSSAEPSTTSSFFEDEMELCDNNDQLLYGLEDPAEAQDIADIQASMASQASQEYGDENAVPTAAEILRAEQETNDPTLACTPARVFTPAKQIQQMAREVCTVSKVPLRPCSDDSPAQAPRQRSKSFGGALTVLADAPEEQHVHLERPAPLKQPATPKLAATALPQTPSSGLRLDYETPGRSSRKSAASDVLKGAVVFVDVHTTEGADASSIFVDLLTQMGARCVKQWNWNPRASLGDALETAGSPRGASPSGNTSTNKVSITHVVYKDGGKRTLEKVRLSNGVVMCVGVGWVLE